MNSSSGNDRLVLVVDDDEAVRSFLSFSLKSEGFRVAEAVNGRDAEKKLEGELPKLVLLDIMMPDMDGFTVCRRMKENARTKNVPVIFITAYADDKSIQKATDAGAQGLVEKPILFDELLLQVLDGLEGRFAMPTRLKFAS